MPYAVLITVFLIPGDAWRDALAAAPHIEDPIEGEHVVRMHITYIHIICDTTLLFI